MKKILRSIARLFVAGAVGAGALFAAVKVGPRVASKIGHLRQRADGAKGGDAELDPVPAVPAFTADEDQAEHADAAAPSEVAPSEAPPPDQHTHD